MIRKCSECNGSREIHVAGYRDAQSQETKLEPFKRIKRIKQGSIGIGIMAVLTAGIYFGAIPGCKAYNKAAKQAEENETRLAQEQAENKAREEREANYDSHAGGSLVVEYDANNKPTRCVVVATDRDFASSYPTRRMNVNRHDDPTITYIAGLLGWDDKAQPCARLFYPAYDTK
jgi:hypothetical protein